MPNPQPIGGPQIIGASRQPAEVHAEVRTAFPACLASVGDLSRADDAMRAAEGALADSATSSGCSPIVTTPTDDRRKLLADTSAIVTSDRLVGLQPPAAASPPGLLGRTCGATSKPRPKASGPSGSSARRACGSASSCSGPGGLAPHRRPRRAAARDPRAATRAQPIARRYSGQASRYRRTRGLARNLPKVWPALRTAKHPGMQPTNNHAERALRGAVIYRKASLGSQSDDGERRIARLPSAHTSCRLQRRSLHAYLSDAVRAHSRGRPVPLLA